MNRIFAILPVHNRLNFTKKCLASFASQKYRNFSVIIIDDGSTDKTFEYVKRKYPQYKMIKGPGNWWWTKSMYEGVKEGLKEADNDDFILEMNNDCYFGPNYLSQLLKTSKKYPNAIIGSLCIRASRPSEVVEAGIRINWPTGLVYGVAPTISNELSYYRNMEVIGELDALPGKGTLIPVKVFKRIGNFNFKKLPHYIADYEFTNRAKRKGFDLLIDTKALVKHYWEATGISSQPDKKIISFKRAWELLFGRKSMSNVIDWINFLYLSCPPEYLKINLTITFWKIFWAVFSIYPFHYFQSLVSPVVNLYHLIKLLSYRIKLKVKQFPKYHLKRRN